MRLSDIHGEKAIDALADLIEPLSVIFADPEVQNSVKKDEPKMILCRKILKAHAKEVITILAILDGEKPELYDVTLLSLPMKLLELLNDPEVQSLFTLQAPNAE